MNSSTISKLLVAAITGSFMLLPQAEAQGNTTANKQNVNVKSSIQYRCMQRAGIPATVAYTPRGAIELIQWQNDFFNASQYTPERRCQEVSDRFQHHSQANNLRFISTGVINNYKAICIAEDTGNCKADGLLLTLEPDDNSETVLRNLFSLEARRQTGGVLRGGGSLPVEPEGKKTIDLNEFLADSPTVDDREYTTK
ncbi:MAG: COP23 domain-containing protein [Cyanobacteria bacterium J06623_7]